MASLWVNSQSQLFIERHCGQKDKKGERVRGTDLIKGGEKGRKGLNRTLVKILSHDLGLCFKTRFLENVLEPKASGMGR